MKLVKILKWSGSSTGDCPAIYSAENGDLVVQGWRLDADSRSHLHDYAADEDAVRVPAGLITDFLARGGRG